jgi:CheY-like chemotaxis protein
MSQSIATGAQPILLVEDSHEDYETTVRALSRAKVANPVVRFCSGEDALEHLRSCCVAESGPALPGVILLDLNLPGMSGGEVLGQIKSDPSLRTIPVIVLTTSNDTRDIEQCYEAGANSYVQKPVDFPGFLRAVQALTDYWFEIVILPQGAR